MSGQVTLSSSPRRITVQSAARMKMSHRNGAPIFVCLAVCWNSAAFAIDENDFEARTFVGTQTTLPYRLFIPPTYDAGYSYPVVLYLHGGGGSGTDNLLQVTGGNAPGTWTWAEPANQAVRPCLVVAPQTNIGWGHMSNSGPNAAMQTVYEILDTLATEFNIDADRIYVTGQSMGGFGTWAAITFAPDRFAAAMPLCGAGDTSKVNIIAHIPEWIFHGVLDQSVDVQYSRDMYAALQAVGAPVQYTEYANLGHDIWTTTYPRQDMQEWLFAQRIGVSDIGDLDGNGRVDLRDFNKLAGYWQQAEPSVDIVEDGIVDYNDLQVIANNWMFGVPIPNQGPIAHYMFDGDANDSSGFGRDGTILGDPTWTVGFDGTTDGAMDFDGTGDLVNCGTFNPSGDGGNLTIAMWVNWDGTVTGADQMVIAKRSSWGTNMMWQITIKNDTGNIQIASGNSPGGMSIGEFGVSITPGVWTHLAITYDGTDAALYRNGANPVSVPFAIGLGATSTVSIGAAYQTGAPTSTMFAGILDEVRLYDRPLTVTEIEQLAAMP